jgi:hypothetical protein
VTKISIKLFMSVCVISLFLGLSNSSYAQNFKLAFVGEEKSFGKHDEAAFKWAKEKLNTTLISVSDLSTKDLTAYAVIWWHEGDIDPTPLMTDPIKKALLNYLQKGGSLLLSAAAEKLATELGIEKGIPRIYGPAVDAQEAGLTVRKDTENHPVWDGFKLKPGDRIKTTNVGYPKSSDYWSLKFVDAKTIGDCWETGSDWQNTVGAFVEWPVNKGLAFGMGWRLPHWATDNKERPTLEKLTTNVLRYLADKSAFLAVKPEGKIATAWGRMKRRSF